MDTTVINLTENVSYMSQNLFLGLVQVEIMHIRLHIFTSSLLFIIISWYNQDLAKLNLVKAGKPIRQS